MFDPADDFIDLGTVFICSNCQRLAAEIERLNQLLAQASCESQEKEREE